MKTTISSVSHKPHGGKNLCLQCRCYINKVCKKQDFDYCKITRSK